MTSLVPLPDLNLMPDSPPHAPSSSSQIALSLAIVPVQPLLVQTLDQDNKKLDRYVFKRTRMIYNSLLLHLTAEKMRRPGAKQPVNSKAKSLMKERGLLPNQSKYFVGPVPGVEIGDIFFYRTELSMYGLHRQLQSGIDFTTAELSSFGVPIATSIVVSGGYKDDEDKGDKLIYSGQGGQDSSGRQRKHQKLEGANLAMVCSMRNGVNIRVIRGFEYENDVCSKVFVYDGLYRIESYSFGRETSSAFDVFKFTLIRIQGQAEMGSARIKRAVTLRSELLNNAIMPDGYIGCSLYGGVPLYLYNDIDSDRSPMNYEYIAQSAISCVISAQGGGNNVGGCECRYSCTDDCVCVRKNGGELPYGPHGNLMRGKPVVFECGVRCKCSYSCANRVAQRGFRKKMEVFRTREFGWGVRSLDLIHAGEFICEYAGVVVTKEQGEIMSMNGDNRLVYPGRFAENWKFWGDLSDVYLGNVLPRYPTLPVIDYAMDVSRMRNVAAFIRYSEEPNVMAQFVFHDHNNLKFPRVMLFAMESISPLTELSLDYMLVDEVDETLAIGG
ncbi:unnamed protein product [Eruca vesicaria subsp. sativa]|uniref:Uncharacterized protein n=1 Tax=Eruca vesicaria subsp. sativa TaxID=29727 RepID=A0ABC8LZQ4_ERUVS|nr:unnamed protein product [Eruca vesicaria subsp. sativa]